MKDDSLKQQDFQGSLSCAFSQRKTDNEQTTNEHLNEVGGSDVVSADVDSGGCVLTQEPSELSRDLAQIKQSVLGVAKTREHLPQPLFWSLFHMRIQGIKRKKFLQRLERSLLYPS